MEYLYEVDNLGRQLDLLRYTFDITCTSIQKVNQNLTFVGLYRLSFNFFHWNSSLLSKSIFILITERRMKSYRIITMGSENLWTLTIYVPRVNQWGNGVQFLTWLILITPLKMRLKSWTDQCEKSGIQGINLGKGKLSRHQWLFVFSYIHKNTTEK